MVVYSVNPSYKTYKKIIFIYSLFLIKYNNLCMYLIHRAYTNFNCTNKVIQLIESTSRCDYAGPRHYGVCLCESAMTAVTNTAG